VESLSPLAGLFAERPETTSPFPTEHAPLSLKRDHPVRRLCIEAGRPKKAVERTGFRGVTRCAVGPSVKDVRPGRRRPSGHHATTRGPRHPPRVRAERDCGWGGWVGGEAEGRAVRVGHVERVRGARGRRRRAAFAHFGCLLLGVTWKKGGERARENEQHETIYRYWKEAAAWLLGEVWPRLGGTPIGRAYIMT